ncbi:MAG: hypothetical protein VKK42_03410 [Lyngbya sp.]|nr:hypothetical protein [Lyngbya sp.]
MVRPYLVMLLVEIFCLTESKILPNRYAENYLRLKTFEEKYQEAEDLLGDCDLDTLFCMTLSTIDHVLKHFYGEQE